jgi:hypothetical protein
MLIFLQKRYSQYGIPIWCLWPNIRFLPSIVAEKNATKNEHLCSMCIKINKVGKQEEGIWWVQKRFPRYGVPIWSLWPNIRYLPFIHMEHKCSFFVAFFSATIDGRNLIFGHKLHIGTPYRRKRFLTRQIPTSCLPNRGGIMSILFQFDWWRNLMGPKTLPPICGTYMKFVTKYQISAINSCWEKCAYMFNVYKNQLSRQTGSRTRQILTSCLPNRGGIMSILFQFDWCNSSCGLFWGMTFVWLKVVKIYRMGYFIELERKKKTPICLWKYLDKSNYMSSS